MFVSRADNIDVMEILSDHPMFFNLKCAITEISEQNANPEAKKQFDKGVDFIKFEYIENKILCDAKYKRNTGGYSGYRGIIKIISNDGDVQVNGESISIFSEEKIIIKAALRPVLSNQVCMWNELDRVIDNTDKEDYYSLLKRHCTIHSSIFNRIKFQLGSKSKELTGEEFVDKALKNTENHDLSMYEKAFDAARYNILSSCGHFPPNLQGV